MLVISGNGAKISYISQDTLDDEANLTLLEYLKNGNDHLELSFVFMLLINLIFPIQIKTNYIKICLQEKEQE